MADNSSLDCSGSTWSILVFTAFSGTHLLLVLPLSAAVLCLGCRRPPSHVASAAASHSDVFTYHILLMELIMVSGGLSCCAGAYAGLPDVTSYGLDIFFSTWSTKIHFHTLTCVEQYLAVVRPISYLGTKTSAGLRIRNVSIACVWLCFVCGMSVALASDVADLIVYYCLVAFALVVVCFCCTSVLCALRRPGPGRAGGRRGQADQKKRRAFYTIVAIMGALLLSLGGMLVGGTLHDTLRPGDGCPRVTSEVWFSLPSSLVSPLLYVHRAGKLPGCKHSSGRADACIRLHRMRK